MPALANDVDRLSERLLECCRVDYDTDCWIWTGATDPNGYGVVRLAGRIYRVHRVSCHVYKGLALTSDVYYHARRSCPRTCFNPDHLARTTRAKFMVRIGGRRHG